MSDYITRADLGGRPGYGAVAPEPEGDLFHADWEARALGLTLAMGAIDAWNIDMSRAARETLPDYERLSYYQVWLAALEKLVEARAGELAAGIAAGRVLRAGDVAAALARGSPTVRASERMPRFKPGDRVRARSERVAHHTRLPGYVHGHAGVVERVHGVHVFADAHAQGLGEQPQWLYGVFFDGTELWGSGTTPGLEVSVDAWEPYLDAE